MKATYDKTADAMYLYARRGKVARTIDFTDDVIVDFDKKGTILGIEILGVREKIGKKDLDVLVYGKKTYPPLPELA